MPDRAQFGDTLSGEFGGRGVRLVLQAGGDLVGHCIGGNLDRIRRKVSVSSGRLHVRVPE